MSLAYFFSFKYWKLRQTGSGHAADSKTRYTIQCSILMLCARYQEAGLCGSREKCDRNYLVYKFAYVHNIQSPGQTGSGHAADSKLRETIKSSILMLCAKYQEAGLCGSPEKYDRNFFVTPSPTTQDDRSDLYMSPPLKQAGHTKISILKCVTVHWFW